MNFIKENATYKKFPNNRKKQTINFFQTVREGRRTFGGSQKAGGDNCGLEAPWISGRRFIQPTRRATKSSYRTGVDVRTILSSLERRSKLSSGLAEDKSSNFFYESSLSEANTKKKKTLSSDSWTFKNSVHNNGETSSSGQTCNPSLPSFFSKGELGSSSGDLPPLAKDPGERLQPLSSNNQQFLKMPTPKAKTALPKNTSKRSSFFDFVTASKENPSKAPADMITETNQRSFFQALPVPIDQENMPEGEFFKKPPTKLKNKNSNEGFFKTPMAIKPQKPNSQEAFFKNLTMESQPSTSNNKFFKAPVIQQSLNSKNGFFNSPLYQIKDSHSKKGFFVKPIEPISGEGFFKSATTSNDGFFKGGTGQPLGFFKDIASDSTSHGGFFKTPSIMKPGKPTSKEGFPATLGRSPVQKTPSFDEFLRPQLNPRTFSSDKMVASDPSSSSKYDSLFETPSRVKRLPKMTTPHLFQPVEKPPSKTSATPGSKTTTKTTNKTTNVVNEDPTYYVLSVTEGRGSAICEVGVAAVDLKHPELILCQFSDVPTYKKLLTKINLLDAAELLMPETFTNNNPSEMYKKVTDTFPDVRVTTAKRIQFSAKSGLDSVRQLMLPDDSSVEVIIYKKYYALAAAEALLRYIEVKHSILFSPKTLKVSFQGAQDVVAMDFETCQRLELVLSSASVLFPEKYSLFGLLNYTKTMGGKRRLRASLMQPSCSQELLDRRLATVSVLVDNQPLLASLQTCLLKFSTVERILWLCRKTPNFKNEAKVFDSLTNYILLLKGSLEAVPHLRKVLEPIEDDHIINIRNELSNEYYELMLIHIKKMIREDARLTKGYASSSRERCFAINEGVNDLLDLARATYSELVEHVLKMVTELAEEYTLPLKMAQTPDMGFHASYTLPRKMRFNEDEVPDIFTEVKTKNRTVHLLTDEMFNLNVRISRAMEEIQLITNVLIYDLVESLKEGMSCLYRLCDRVADLDLLSTLAQVSSTPDYVRPVFTGQTSLIGARHPIMDHICPTKPIPNNITASKTSNFNIITGPNMSGKTVYVLTIPLIQIMAQVGCYVPADKAELRIADHIFVRKGNTDNMQCKLSASGVEIKELLYTLKILTSRSLIVLDELCANTSCERGICLAWAFCEQFLRVPAFTFLTTHYHYLCNLSKVYRNVSNFHLEAIERSNDSLGELTFTHRLLPGVTQMSNYALRLMMSSALPEEVKQYALEVAADLMRRRETNLPICIMDDPVTAKELAKIQKLENFMSNLKAVRKTDKYTPNLVRALQRMAREEILSDLESDGDKSNGGDGESSSAEESDTLPEDIQQKEADGMIEENMQKEQVISHHQPPENDVIDIDDQLLIEDEVENVQFDVEENFSKGSVQHSGWKPPEKMPLDLNNLYLDESGAERCDENENDEFIENPEVEIFIQQKNNGLLTTENQSQSPCYERGPDPVAMHKGQNFIESPSNIIHIPIVDEPETEDEEFEEEEGEGEGDSEVLTSSSSDHARKQL